MSATIGNFYERVSRAIRRGTVYDDDIPGYASDAVRELERAHNWNHMFLAARNTLEAGEDRFTLGRVKSIREVNLVFGEGTSNENYVPLVHAKKESMTSRPNPGRPTAWFYQGLSMSAETQHSMVMAFDAFADQDYKIGIDYYLYSARPLENDLRWLFFAEELLMARTIRKMQPILRDDKLIARWAEVENAEMQTLLAAEDEFDNDGVNSAVVPFADEMEEERIGSMNFDE